MLTKDNKSKLTNNNVYYGFKVVEVNREITEDKEKELAQILYNYLLKRYN
mgnify:CR=1 FL=1